MLDKINKYLLLIKGLLCRQKPKDASVILILFTAAFGDAILFQNYMHELVNKYPNGGGTRLRIFCRQGVKDFYINVLGFSGAYFCTSTYTKKFSDIKNAIMELQTDSYSTIYAKDGALETSVIASNLKASKVIRVTSDVEMNNRSTINRFLINKCFTDTTIVPMDTWELNRHTLLLEKYEGVQVDPLVPNMRSVLDIHPYFDCERKYAVISMDTSVAYRSWNKEKYFKIIQYIISKYDYDVVLCGTNEYNIETINDRLINCTGKTTFTEWLEIIQFAELVIGVDSAAIHVALSLETPAVVLRGYYEGNKYFPYPTNGNYKPKCICVTSTAEYMCQLCLQRKNIMKKHNLVCYSQCFEKKGIMSCLDGISEEQVKDAIKELL